MSSDAEPEVGQPGLGRLREAAAGWRRRHLPGRSALRRDAVAGLSLTAANVPDGMANAILVGVNPLYGLYATIVGPLAGGLLSSTRLMVVTTTAAASVTAGQALGGLVGAERESALFLMVVLTGAFQVIFGVLDLGRLTRFVSFSVMTGFLMGVGVLIVLSQLPSATGYAAQGANATARFLDLLLHLDEVDVASLGVAMLTLALALALPRTRLGNFGILVAIAVPSALVALAGMDSIRTVRDVGEFARGFPLPQLPSFGNALQVVSGAFAVAVVIVVQAAGVSQSVPNPEGARANASRDFVAMGVANVACGFIRALPVGGSLSATALSLLAGAGSRWAAIFAGVWMGVVVIAFPQLVSPIAIPALGALLVLAGARTLQPTEVVSIWRTGWPSRLTIVATFFAMLSLPIQAAVAIGVVLSALLYVTGAATDVVLVEQRERPDGSIEERRPHRELTSNAVTVLHVYGHIFYAGARTLERQLPAVYGARNPVVVLRLRGRTHVGATLIEVLTRYAGSLQKANGRLYLTGLSRQLHDDIVRTGKLDLAGPVRAYEATPVLGQSTREAIGDAQSWLVSVKQGGDGTPLASK